MNNNPYNIIVVQVSGRPPQLHGLHNGKYLSEEDGTLCIKHEDQVLFRYPADATVTEWNCPVAM